MDKIKEFTSFKYNKNNIVIVPVLLFTERYFE